MENNDKYRRSLPTAHSSQLLAKKRKVLLPELLLRILQVLTDNDSDQRYIDIYNELKPDVERRLRRRGESVDGS